MEMTKEERNRLARELIASLQTKGYSHREIGIFIGRSRGFIAKITADVSTKDVRLLLQADIEKPALPRRVKLHSYVYSDTFPFAMTTKEIIGDVLDKKQAEKVTIEKHLGTLTLAGNGEVQHLRLRVWHKSQDIRSKKSNG